MFCYMQGVVILLEVPESTYDFEAYVTTVQRWENNSDLVLKSKSKSTRVYEYVTVKVLH